MSEPLIDIRPDHWAIVADILRRHVPDREVWAFGSRAKWNAKEYSDLDLAVIGQTPLSLSVSAALADDFAESDLPFKVDVVDWETTSESFRKIIERDKVVVQEGKGRSLGMAASEWASMRLGAVCIKIGSGATPRGGGDVCVQNGPYALIRSQNVYNEGFHRDGLAFIGEKHATELQNVKVLSGDVLLNITGDSVARACQVDPGVLPARVNQHVAIIRPYPDKLAPRFLRYFLVSPEMQTKLLSWAGSGGPRNALTKGMIESFEVHAPTDVSEQCAIAHILGTLDDKIELNRRMNETLEAMARALFKSWFVDFEPVRAKAEERARQDGARSGQLRKPLNVASDLPWPGAEAGAGAEGDPLPAPQSEAARQAGGLPKPVADLFPDRFEDSELGEIPAGWEVRTLGDLLELAYGKALKAEDRRDGDVPVYGSNGQVGWHEERLAEGPGIVVGRKGNPGVATWAPTDFFVIDTAFYVVPKGPCPSLYFLLHVLQAHDLASLGADSAVPGLNRNLAYMSTQLLPSPPLLAKFDAHASALAARVHACNQESRNLAALRDTLLPKLISGELRVQDAERFIARAV